MSWKTIEIEQKSFLFNCNVEDETLVKFYLCNFQSIWEEKCPINELLARARDLNKRIEYDIATILKTIITTPSQLSFSINKNSDTNDSLKIDSSELNLKYYLFNRPFNFKWKLKLCDSAEFMRLITKPLLLSVSTLSQQNAELKNIVIKKDTEIEQYKLDGATLKRSKLATVPFNLERFEEKYPFKPVDEFVQFAVEKYDDLKKDIGHDFGRNSNVTPEKATTSTSGTPKKIKKSPKGARANYRNHILNVQQHLQSCVTKPSFDDSDSCTPPANNDIAEIEKSLEELKRRQQEDLQKKRSPEPNKKLKMSRKALNL